MGRGPLHLLEHGIEAVLQEPGHTTGVTTLEATPIFPNQVATGFELYRKVAEGVREARKRGAFPLVLSGNCSAAVGTTAGCSDPLLGIIWFDAHGDFNTPETTESGFLDGMPLAIIAGRCWRTLAASVPGFAAIPDTHIMHVGARDLDTHEKEALHESRITMIDAAAIVEGGAIREILHPALASLSERVERVYLHLDLDVLDPREACANSYVSLEGTLAEGPHGGLSVDQVAEAIDMIKEHCTIAACGIASYDPEYDNEGRTLRAALRFASLVLPGL
jgi:arginase